MVEEKDRINQNGMDGKRERGIGTKGRERRNVCKRIDVKPVEEKTSSE